MIYLIKGFLAIAYLIAGGAKIVGAKPLAEQFREFGLPLGAVRIVGALEVAGAIGLWVEPFPLWAALGLGGLMIGAIGNHLKVSHPLSRTVPSLIMLVLCGVAVWFIKFLN